MRESLIESKVVEYARSRGWAAYKWASPGTKGVHDHIFFKGGLCFTIEFKAPGKKATKLQRMCAETLQSAGIYCACVDAIHVGKHIVDVLTRFVDGRDQPFMLPFDIESFKP